MSQWFNYMIEVFFSDNDTTFYWKFAIRNNYIDKDINIKRSNSNKMTTIIFLISKLPTNYVKQQIQVKLISVRLVFHHI